MLNAKDTQRLLLDEAASLVAAHPQIACCEGPAPDMGEDFRTHDSVLSLYLMTLTARSRRRSNPIAMATWIYTDAIVADRLYAVTCDRSALSRVKLSAIIDTPAIIAGYTAIFTASAAESLAMTRWYLSVLRGCVSRGLGLYIEICGTYRAGTNMPAAACAGNVNPSSRPALTAARMLGMERLEGLFEPNTLGPVFWRPGARPSCPEQSRPFEPVRPT